METIGLISPDGEWIVSGSGADAVWGDVRRLGGVDANGDAQTTLVFAMRGSPADLQTALDHLTRFADRVGRSGGWIWVTAAGATQAWRSPVRQVQLALLGTPVGDRTTGCLGVRMTLAREHWWEGEECSLPLTNRYGIDLMDGLRVDNHFDSGHDNTADVAGEDVAGSLPAPVRVDILPEPAVPGVLGELTLGWWQGESAGTFEHVLEAEDSATSLSTSVGNVPGASGGMLRTVVWSSSAEQELMVWTLSPSRLLAAGGRYFRPLLRLGSGWLGGEVWLKLRLTGAISGAPPLWESPEVLLTTGCAVVRFPPQALPTWLPDSSPAPVMLSLRGLAPGGASQTLVVDFVQLVPQDGGLRVDLPAALPNGTTISISSTGQALAHLPAGELAVPPVEGQVLMVVPGCSARLFVLHGTGDLPAVGAAVRIRMSYRPRVWEV